VDCGLHGGLFIYRAVSFDRWLAYAGIRCGGCFGDGGVSGKVKYLPWITRNMLRAEPESIFVFGDNFKRVGMGGQAGAMRGESNALGVATKNAPGCSDADYFSGSPKEAEMLLNELSVVVHALADGRTVYVPADGLGTGLSELPKRAPALANLITAFFQACPGEPCPWEFI
jgi:hypothetical protein